MATPSHSESPLGPFLRFLRDYRVIWYLIGFGAAPYLLDLIFAVGPPWPQATGVAAFTSLATWLVLFYSYSIWDDLKKAGLRQLVKVFTSIAGCSLVIFIILKAFLCMDAPDFRHQEAVGWVLQPNVVKLLRHYEQAGQPSPTIQDLFEGAEYRPERIWTEGTVNTSRVALLLSWLLLFGSVSTLISVFVLIQHFKHSQIIAKAALKTPQDLA